MPGLWARSPVGGSERQPHTDVPLSFSLPSPLSKNIQIKCFFKCLKKLSIKLPYNPAIPLLGIQPKESNLYGHVHSAEHSGQKGGKPTCSLTDERMNKIKDIKGDNF